MSANSLPATMPGYRSTKLEAYRVMAASTSLSYLSMRVTQLIVMVAGTWFVLHGALSEGGFVGFLLLVGVFFRPVDKINAVIETYPKGIAGFRRYLALLDTAPDVVDRPNARSAGTLRGDIRFESVGFGYAPGRPVLDGIDLTIKAGETVAFVGPSGGRQDHVVRPAAALFTTSSKAASPSTAPTSAT